MKIPKEEGYPDAFLIEKNLKKKVLLKGDAERYINNLKEMISDEEYHLAIRGME